MFSARARFRVSTQVRTAVCGLAFGASLLTATSPSATADVACDDAYASSEFGGTKVSQTYSSTFDTSAALHWLDKPYTPQGLAAWPNWDGSGEDLLVVSAHHVDENANASLIYGMTPGGEHRGAAYIGVGAHAGAAKVYGDWLYVQHSQSTLRRYPLSAVRASFEEPGTTSIGSGEAVAVTGVSSFDIDGGYLYGATFNDSARDVMRRWKINPDTGDLTLDTVWGPLQVPMKTQGLQVHNDRYIFSTSYGRTNRGNVYVVERGYGEGDDFTSKPYACFRSVAMIQDLVDLNGTTYLGNESGSEEFADGRIHNIRNLHVANTASLRGVIG